jgi:RNA polymerase sigma-70 factor (ECF subfamily)
MLALTHEKLAPALELRAVHEAHADFVWATLFRMGVREADLPDMLQEVFVVVHRRIESFDAGGKLTSWLYGICRKVAAAYRRRPHNKRELLTGEMPQDLRSAATSEDELEARQAQWTLERVLGAMDVDRRATFVMYEIDGLSGEAISQLLEIPVGTVYSRLHAARREFESALADMEKTPQTRRRA